MAFLNKEAQLNNLDKAMQERAIAEAWANHAHDKKCAKLIAEMQGVSWSNVKQWHEKIERELNYG